jgi:hypothetical protein
MQEATSLLMSHRFSLAVDSSRHIQLFQKLRVEFVIGGDDRMTIVQDIGLDRLRIRLRRHGYDATVHSWDTALKSLLLGTHFLQFDVISTFKLNTTPWY